MAATVGYSRAVRVGPHVHVAGTAPIMPGEIDPPPDAYSQVGRAHGEVFGSVLPASAFVVVKGLLDPRWRVELEADALVP